MTVIEIVSKVPGSERVSVVKRPSDEFLIDASRAEDLLDSRHFHKEIADLEVCGLCVGALCDLVISVD